MLEHPVRVGCILLLGMTSIGGQALAAQSSENAAGADGVSSAPDDAAADDSATDDAATTEATANDAAANDTAVDDAATSGAAQNERHAIISVDPLGLLLFGPTVNGEVAFGSIGVGAGFRWFSPGLLANELFLNSTDEFAFSFGFSARGQYYFTEPLSGPHVGVVLDYLHVRVENDVRGIATISDYVVPQLEGGYRHFFGRFFIGGAVSVGYAAQVGSSVENLPGRTEAHLYSVSDESSVYGNARLDLGISF